MGSALQHKHEYEKDTDFLNNGIKNQGKYSNWTIIVMFYCSVHLLEMILADKGCVTINSHEDRLCLMREKLLDFGKIRDDYIQLKQLSRTAWYGLY